MNDAALDRAGRSALHYAALENRTEELQRLLDAGADIDAADRAGFTALHFAAQQNALEALELLLRAGAEIDPEDAYGNTPLSRATFNDPGDGRAIALLRAAGADPWHVNRSGVSPVALARKIANKDVRRWYADVGDAPPR